MFGFLKSSESIEANLRAWSLEDTMRLMDASERPEWERYCAERNLRELAEDVASKCVTQLESDKMFMQLSGKQPSIKETWRYSRGIELVKDLAKKSWRVSFEGSPAMGYACKIVQI